MKIKAVPLVALALALAATPLVAPSLAAQGRDEGPARPGFAQLDADGSGAVTAAEIEAFRDARFARIDADGDGMISRAEFLARAQERAGSRAERMFDRLDADGDGSLPRDLLAARDGPDAAALIKRLDADGDGAVDAAEFEAGREKMVARMRDGHKGQHGAGGFLGRAN